MHDTLSIDVVFEYYYFVEQNLFFDCVHVHNLVLIAEDRAVCCLTKQS